VLLIADEVITGFGRTGRWFALGRWDVQPDLMSFAKGVTSGYLPLGGVVVSKYVHQVIEEAPLDERFMHAATYSGHPVCCAVGLRNIDIIEQEGLPDRAAVMGKKLLAGLDAAQPAVGRRRARSGHDGCRRIGRGPGDAQAGDRAWRTRGVRGNAAWPDHPRAWRWRHPGKRRLALHCAAADDAGSND